MNRHIPGPWYTNEHYKTKVFANTPAGLMVICDIRGWGHLTGSGGLKLSEEEAAEIQDAHAALITAAPDFVDACRAVLMFHHGGPWTQVAQEWERIVGTREATTRTLCDHIRKVLAKAKVEL